MANISRREGERTARLARREWDPFRAMRDLVRWDPLGALGDPFREMLPALGQHEHGLGFVPQFDVKETKDAYVFKADLPGVKQENIDISLTGNRLSVSGHRESEVEEGEESYYTCERSCGSFSRGFTLPEGVDPEHIRAEMKDGILTLLLPKRPELQPKKISIQTGAGSGGKAKATS
jgi:HSP20 family protein